MMKSMLIILLTAGITANAQPNAVNKKYNISVSLDSSLKGPYTGTLRLYTQKDTARGFGGEHTLEEPAFSIQVKNWKAGETKFFDASAHPQQLKLTDVKPGYYKMVAILDTNTTERGNNAYGNLYTRREGILQVTDSGATGKLMLSNAFPQRPFPASDSIKEVVLPSPLLASFRKTAIFHKAGVYLPPSYFTKPQQEFPVVYVIPGWGGVHQQVAAAGARKLYGVGLGDEKIYVFLNPEVQTPYGLHAYVDSRVNGPWGTALVNELIPYIQQKFRASKDPKRTFLMGQSSGGYGALWLALHFPSMFGGSWVTAPDPVDFSSFVGIDIYKDKNAFVDEKGEERGFYLVNGKPQSSIREGYIKEVFDGDGGQQQSFEAEFGLPGKDGRPQPLYDASGKINRKIAESWKPYDMSLYVKANASKLRREMTGPVKVYAGSKDNFFLDKAVMAFGEKIKPLGLNIQTIIIENADHFSTRSEKLAAEIAKEMQELLNAH